MFGYSNTTVAADTIVAGTLNNVMPLVRNFLFTTEDEIFATGWRNEFTLNDEWIIDANVRGTIARWIIPAPTTEAKP